MGSIEKHIRIQRLNGLADRLYVEIIESLENIKVNENNIWEVLSALANLTEIIAQEERELTQMIAQRKQQQEEAPACPGSGIKNAMPSLKKSH